jgi:hypothetical protein
VAQGPAVESGKKRRGVARQAEPAEGAGGGEESLMACERGGQGVSQRLDPEESAEGIIEGLSTESSASWEQRARTPAQSRYDKQFASLRLRLEGECERHGFGLGAAAGPRDARTPPATAVTQTRPHTSGGGGGGGGARARERAPSRIRATSAVHHSRKMSMHGGDDAALTPREGSGQEASEPAPPRGMQVGLPLATDPADA